MARITLDHIRHAYGPNPKSDKDYALREVDHEWNDGGAYALLGPPAAARRRCSTSSPAAATVAWPHPVRRQGCHEPFDAGAQHRAGVPVPRDLRHDDGLRQSGLSAAQPRRAEAEVDRACAKSLEMIDLAPMARRKAQRADRRPEAEDLARPRAGAQRRQRHPVRRAADGDRSAHEMGAALAAEARCTSSSASPWSMSRTTRPRR
jgi:hypothetical protein